MRRAWEETMMGVMGVEEVEKEIIGTKMGWEREGTLRRLELMVKTSLME